MKRKRKKKIELIWISNKTRRLNRIFQAHTHNNANKNEERERACERKKKVARQTQHMWACLVFAVWISPPVILDDDSLAHETTKSKSTKKCRRRERYESILYTYKYIILFSLSPSLQCPVLFFLFNHN